MCPESELDHCQQDHHDHRDHQNGFDGHRPVFSFDPCTGTGRSKRLDPGADCRVWAGHPIDVHHQPRSIEFAFVVTLATMMAPTAIANAAKIAVRITFSTTEPASSHPPATRARAQR